MPSIDVTTCCGAIELYDIQSFTPMTAKTFFANIDENTERSIYYYPIIVFSDTQFNLGGRTLAKWIKDKRFGRLTKSNWVRNPNSGNFISVWTWTLNAKAKKFLEECE